MLGSRALLSATAFYNDVTSLTAFDASGAIRPDADPFGRSAGYHNSSGGFSAGLELGVEARPNDAVRVRASYTYTQAETEEDVTVPGFFRVPGVFRHTATFVATGRVSRRLDATCDLFYGSDSYSSFFAAGRSRAYRFPAFAKVAVVAGYRLLDAGRRSVRAYIETDNLFDTTYYEGGWRNPGRTIVAGVSAGF
jgi:outer membrane receptor for ferrienterochelin and colicin